MDIKIAICLALIIVTVLTAVAMFVIDFRNKPKDEQVDNVIEWLKGVVFLMEKEFGGGTGQLKLAAAYGEFVKLYPKLAQIVPFATFKLWVDGALDWLKEQIEKNPKIRDMLMGSDST